MDNEHAPQLIADYVLGLLSTDESRRVERHAQQCAACREAIRRERQVGILLRQVVQTTARPPARLAPARLPAPRPAAYVRRRLYRQLTPLTALAVLLVAVLLAQANGFGWPTPVFAQTARPPTATATHTPTATLAAVAATTTRTTAPPRPAASLPADPAPEPRPLLVAQSTTGPAAAAEPQPAAATPIIPYTR